MLSTSSTTRERPSRAPSLSDVRREVIEQHRGRWVVVDDDEVTLVADSLAELMRRATELGVRKGSMRRIPAADEFMFVGLC